LYRKDDTSILAGNHHIPHTLPSPPILLRLNFGGQARRVV